VKITLNTGRTATHLRHAYLCTRYNGGAAVAMEAVISRSMCFALHGATQPVS
jgi:hypothetical protein